MSKISKPVKKKNPAAVALARLGASKGGKARAKKLSAQRRVEIAHAGSKGFMESTTPEQRRENARKAVLARWSKRK
jgi:hypothetical protein